MMSAVMMLNHEGGKAAAGRIRGAYDAVLRDGKPEEVTGVVGGRGTSSGFAEAVIQRLRGRQGSRVPPVE